jgi:hypothetical protein
VTNDEFQRAYHDYRATDREQSLADAGAIELEDGQHPAVAGFPFPSGAVYVLMLPSAAQAVADGLAPGEIEVLTCP